MIIIEKLCRSIVFVAQSQIRDPSIPTHKREYEDCKQILKLSPSHAARSRYSPPVCHDSIPGHQVSYQVIDEVAWAIAKEHDLLLFAAARLIPLPRAARCKSPLGYLLTAHEVWRLSSFSSGKFCELRDFACGRMRSVSYLYLVCQFVAYSSDTFYFNGSIFSEMVA